MRAKLGMVVVGWMLVGHAVAQTGRVAHVAVVQGPDGKPLAAAEVTFVAAPAWLPFAAAGDAMADVVRARSDGKGRCEVSLLAGRDYVVWPARAAGGGVAVGNPVRWVGTGGELRCLPHDVVVAPKCQVQGSEAWRQHGPLRGQWFVLGTAWGDATDLDATGRLAAPPVPPSLAELRLFGAGAFVFAGALTPGKPIVLPPPDRITVRTRDGHGGEFGEADVALLLPNDVPVLAPWPRVDLVHRLPLVRTGRDGSAVLCLAHTRTHKPDEDVPALAFLATAPGRSPCVSGFGGRQYEAGEYLSVFMAASELGFPLPSLGAPPGHVLGVPPGTELAVDVAWTVPDRARTRRLVDRWLLPIGSDGSVRAGLPKGAAPVALWLPPPPAMVPPTDPFAGCPALPVLLPTSVLQAGVAMANVVPWRVVVVDGAGVPVAGCELLCSPLDGAAFVDPRHAVRGVSDAGGRALVPACRGRWLCAAQTPAAFGMLVVDVDGAETPTRVPLEPLSRMAVRVVDGAGRAVRGAQLRARVTAWGEAPDAERHALQALGVHLAYAGLQSITTGPDGRAVIPFVAATPASLTVEARSERARSEAVPLAARAEPVDLVLR